MPMPARDAGHVREKFETKRMRGRTGARFLTCVDVLAGQHGEGLVLVAEHLDEHKVPDLQHVGVILPVIKR